MREYFELCDLRKTAGSPLGAAMRCCPSCNGNVLTSAAGPLRRNWPTILPIGQCTPGIIAVNVSTFIGDKRKGILGGIIATVGFTFFPIVLLSLVAAGLGYLLTYPIVQSAFGGVRVCVCVLILNAVLRLWKKSVLDKRTLAIFLAIFLLSVFGGLLPMSISPAVYVVAAALAGLALAPGAKKEDK